MSEPWFKEATKDFFPNWGNLNMDWILDDIKHNRHENGVVFLCIFFNVLCIILAYFG